MSDERDILRLFEDGDRALISGNVTELERIYADDYVQYDESGKASTRGDLIRNLTSGAIRFIAMISTLRSVRFLRDDLAVVHGAEKDEVERGSNRVFVGYVYMDVVEKRGGRWQIVASQLAKTA
jgi:hypothetical protein